MGVGAVAGKESRRCEMCVQHRKRKCGPNSKFKGCLRRLRDQNSRCPALPAFYPDTREWLVEWVSEGLYQIMLERIHRRFLPSVRSIAPSSRARLGHFGYCQHPYARRSAAAVTLTAPAAPPICRMHLSPAVSWILSDNPPAYDTAISGEAVFFVRAHGQAVWRAGYVLVLAIVSRVWRWGHRCSGASFRSGFW